MQRRTVLDQDRERLRGPLTLIIFSVVITVAGCLPEPLPLDGPLSYDDANGELFEMHSEHGTNYKAEHTWNGKPFTANWELSNYLFKRAKLQIKPSPDDFDEVDLCMALETALADKSTNPWHNVADDTILDCFRKAIRNEDSHLAYATCPDAPYEVTVKVKNNVSEWFCEVRIENKVDPEKLKEGAKLAQQKLDDLERRHAND